MALLGIPMTSLGILVALAKTPEDDTAMVVDLSVSKHPPYPPLLMIEHSPPVQNSSNLRESSSPTLDFGSQFLHAAIELSPLPLPLPLSTLLQTLTLSPSPHTSNAIPKLVHITSSQLPVRSLDPCVTPTQIDALLSLCMHHAVLERNSGYGFSSLLIYHLNSY